MKKIGLMLLLLFSVFVFSLDIAPVWDEDYVTLPYTPYMQGAGIALKQTGEFHVLTKDTYYYVINRLGEISKNYGSEGSSEGWKHISYPVLVNNYIIYVASNYDGKSKVVIRNGSTSKVENIDGNISRAPTVFYDDSNNDIHIYVGYGKDVNSGVCHIRYDVDTDSVVSSNTYNTVAPVKIAPILAPDKSAVFALDANGNFYNIPLDASYELDKSNVKKDVQLKGYFETPMAYNGEEGYIYALSRTGMLYKIRPEGDNTDVEFRKLGISSVAAGILIDSSNYIYVFDDLGTIYVVKSEGLFIMKTYSINQDFDGYKFATTPLLMKRSNENKIYMFILLNNDNEKNGKAVIYSMDYDDYSFTKEWERSIDDTFPVIGSPVMVPLSAIDETYYIIAFTTTHDRVYAYRVDAKGPYGTWAMEGQNAYRTGFVDENAPTILTSITLIAKDKLSGLELNKEILNDANGKYGLVFDATVVSIEDSGDISLYQTEEFKTNPDTYNNNGYANDEIPMGKAGVEKLLLSFSTETTLTLLFNDSFIMNITNNAISSPIVDATYAFHEFDAGIPGFDATTIESNTATITFGYDDKVANVFVESTYAVLVKYNLPDDVSTSLLEFGKDETTKVIKASDYNMTTDPATLFAYKWKVYQWEDNTKNLKGYNSWTYESIDELTLGIDELKKAPTYVEIYYTPLTGTVTFVVPMYAESETRGFILIDAAKGALSSTLYATLTSPLIGMSLSTITSIEYNPEFNLIEDLEVLNEDYMKLVFVENSDSGLSVDTRVATIVLELNFDESTLLYFQNQAKYFDIFDIELYTQLKNNTVEEGLLSKTKFIANKYLTLPGDFNLDGVVDDDDYIMFRNALSEYVHNGVYDPKYDIGPREDFVPPSRGFQPGFSKKDGKIDEWDLNVFLVMYGYAAPTEDIEYSGN